MPPLPDSAARDDLVPLPAELALAALSQLAEGVIITDAAGRITFVNAAAAQLHGVARLDVAPEGYADTYHLLTEAGEPYPSTELPLARAVLRGETVTDARWRIRRPDGTEIPAVGSARPVRDAMGVQQGAVLTVRDDSADADSVRARHEAEALAARLRLSEQQVRAQGSQLETLADNASLGLFVMDDQQQCTYMNPAAERLTGFTLAELRGRALHDVVHHSRPDGTPYPRDDCPIERAFPENRRVEGEESFIHKDGQFYQVAFTASPIRDGERTVGTIIELRDIREQKRRERDYARLLRAEHAARERAESLQQVTAMLAQSATMADVARVFSRELTALVGADTTWVGVITDDGEYIEAVGWAGYADDVVAKWRRIPIDAGIALADAVRSGEPQWWPTRDALVAAYADRAPIIRSAAQESVAVLPLLGGDSVSINQRGATIGGIVVGFHDVRPFDDDTRSFLLALAQQCAQAIVRVRAREAEQSARHRAEVLQAMTASLAAAETVPEVARAAVAAAIEGSGAPSATIALLSADGEWLQRCAEQGMSVPLGDEWQKFPSRGPFPAAEVIATSSPIFLENRGEYLRRFPGLRDSLEALAIHASAILPLRRGADGQAAGYLSMHYTQPHDFSAGDVVFLQALAHVTAQAIERARLYEAEQAARSEAEAARAAAEAANRAKGEFLAVMSHELRTPLNAIGGYVELIELGIHGPITDAQRVALGRVQRSQKHLLGLITQVLNYARLEAGALEFDIRPVGVAAAVSAVESYILPQVRAKQVELVVTECPVELAVLADADKLSQVLLNLLSNAVKFTPAGGRIGIVCVRVDERVEIAVSDSGIGIAPEQLERIFEPFVQIGRTLTSPGEGAGLGLAISRDLMQGMAGELTAESRVGEGSTFRLRLPIAPA